MNSSRQPLHSKNEKGQALFEYAVYLSFLIIVGISIGSVLEGALRFTFLSAVLNRDPVSGVPVAVGGEYGDPLIGHDPLNQPPVVSFDTSPDPPIVFSGDAITFTSNSYDPDAGDQIESHVWDIYGDGSVVKTGDVVTHTFTTTDPNAIYVPRLTVTDNHGVSVSQSFAVGVYTTTPPNLPPVPVISVSPLSGPAPLNVTFTSSSYDPDGTVDRHQWYLGPNLLIQEEWVEYHTYDTPGEYEVELTVTDNDGRKAKSHRVFITVEEPADPNTPPSVNARASNPNPLVGEQIQLITDSALDSDGTIEYYQWDLGDGSDLIGPHIFTGIIAPIYHTYSSAGNYVAKIIVTDNEGGTAIDTVAISVGNAPAPTSTPLPTATPAPTAAPLPTATPSVAECNFEAEHASKIKGPAITNNHSGYSGTGFVDYPNDTGNQVYVQWSVNIATAGVYNVDFRYALNSGSRPLEYKVNGAVVDAALPFNSTGGWASWDMSPTLVYLNAGQNKIQLTAKNNAGPNVDCMAIYP